MIGVLRQAVDNFLGRGEAAVTVPVMDGPLKPNQLLEAAGRVLTAPDIDNLAATADGMLYTSGSTVVGIPGGEVARFPSAISCLAVDGSGAMAIGLSPARSTSTCRLLPSPKDSHHVRTHMNSRKGWSSPAAAAT